MSKLLKFFLVIGLFIIVFRVVAYIIAGQNISSSVNKGRINAFMDAADQLIDGVKIATLSNPKILPSSGAVYVKISDIRVARVSNTTSPFDKAYTASSYVKVEESAGDYIYSICLIDSSGNGIGEVGGIPIVEKDLDTSDVKKGGQTCTTPATFITNLYSD
jgi:hypothetical protein